MNNSIQFSDDKKIEKAMNEVNLLAIKDPMFNMAEDASEFIETNMILIGHIAINSNNIIGQKIKEKPSDSSYLSYMAELGYDYKLFPYVEAYYRAKGITAPDDIIEAFAKEAAKKLYYDIQNNPEMLSSVTEDNTIEFPTSQKK